MRMLSRRSLLFCLVLSALSCSAFAALGGDVSSIQADQAHMRAQRRVVQNAAYTVHEMQTESATVVREFVSPDGKVFGISWQGPTRPDLQQMLGNYYSEFAASRPTRRMHGPVTIRTQNLIIQSGGHMRALTGRAFVPAMVPADVRVEDIK
ncbi:MAG TPA: DUF2844 domain-containing protein [Candidatus Sulfotelmatobacter sp.]|nr:DUF2844 domain-containing protein [Candidatus Sulfotelmatobacter sp.]